MTDTCGFQGDDNTYGLGIRLGLYIQWIATSLANNFVPDEAVAMRSVNFCFQLSTFVGLLYITIDRHGRHHHHQQQGDDDDDNEEKRTLYAVEAFIVLLFCLGGACSRSIYSGNVVSTYTHHQASALGNLLQQILYTALAAYGVWFVFVGMDRMPSRSGSPPCSRSRAFFFAKVDLYHWFRTLLKIVFVVAAVVQSTLGFYRMIAPFVKYGVRATLFDDNKVQQQGEDDHQQQQDENGRIMSRLGSPPPPQQQQHQDQTQNQGIVKIENIAVSSGLVFFIVASELNIRWNHIRGVNSLGSTGQLIPLVVAGSGLIRVLYKCILHYLRGDYRKFYLLWSPFLYLTYLLLDPTFLTVFPEL